MMTWALICSVKSVTGNDKINASKHTQFLLFQAVKEEAQFIALVDR